MDTRKPIDSLAVSLMVLLSMIWGLQQVAIKLGASDMSPVLQMGVRSGIAAFFVGIVMLWQKQRINYAVTWLPGLIAGLMFGVEFLVIGEGLRFTTASHMVVFLYTAPIWAALGLHWKLPSEHLNKTQWVGIALAFAGIAVTFLFREGSNSTASAPNMLLGDALALFAGFLWGATTVLVRTTKLTQAPATETLQYQLVVSCVLLVIAAPLMGQAHVNMTTALTLNLAFQGIVVAFASYLTWFWLLRHYPASQLGVFSFMTPLFGIVFGVWILNESLSTSFIYGAILVMTGILLVNGHEKVKIGMQRLRAR